MRIELEKRLAVAQRNCNDAHKCGDMYGVNYYDGQISLLKDLLSIDNQYSHDDAEFENNNPYCYFSDIDEYMFERRDLIEEQIEIAYDTHHFTRGLGKSVVNSDGYWFTSDEIEAFRVIWQRRLSNLMPESND